MAIKKLPTAILPFLGLLPLSRGNSLAAYAHITPAPDPRTLQLRQDLIWTCHAGYTACADPMFCCPKGAACTIIHGQKGCNQACYGAPCGYLCCDMGDVCSGTGTDAFCVRSTLGPIPTLAPVATVTFADSDTDTSTLPSWTLNVPGADQSTTSATSSSQTNTHIVTPSEGNSSLTIPKPTSPAPGTTKVSTTGGRNTESPMVSVATPETTPPSSSQSSSAADGEKRPWGLWVLFVLLGIGL